MMFTEKPEESADQNAIELREPAETASEVSQGNSGPELTDAELAQYSSQISDLFRSQVPNVIEAAALFCEVRKKTPKNNRWKAFKNGLLVHKSTVSKLGTIGKNLHLQNPEVQKQLPNRVSTLYYIARQKPEMIDLWIKEGKIHPLMQRKDIEPPKETSAAPASDKSRQLILELPVELEVIGLAQLKVELGELGAKYGFKIADVGAP